MYKAMSVLCRIAAVLLLPFFLMVPAEITAEAAKKPVLLAAGYPDYVEVEATSSNAVLLSVPSIYGSDWEGQSLSESGPPKDLPVSFLKYSGEGMNSMVSRTGDDLPDYQQPVLPERPADSSAFSEEQTGQPDGCPDFSGDQLETISLPADKDENPAPVYADPADLRSLTDREDEKAEEARNVPQEQITDTMTAISGQRLNRLMEWNRDSVLFEKQGVAVSLPTDFLRELDLGYEDLLSVTIQALESGFSLTVSLESGAVTTLPETLVRFPARNLAPDEAVELVDEVGNRYPAAWNGDTGLITATITRTGRYRIQKQKDSQAGETLIKEEPIPRQAKGRAEEEQYEKNRERTVDFLLEAVMLAGIGAGIFLYRKRGRR